LQATSQIVLPLVPYPQEIRLGKDEFTLDAQVVLAIDPALQFESDYLVNEINFRSGIQIGTQAEKGENPNFSSTYHG
jgi:hypothetical protein